MRENHVNWKDPSIARRKFNFSPTTVGLMNSFCHQTEIEQNAGLLSYLDTIRILIDSPEGMFNI